MREKDLGQLRLPVTARAPGALAAVPLDVYTVYMSTRDKILDAARKAFDRSGLEGLSLRDIAAQVGITPMAIYRHFDGKDALVDALVLDALGEWSAIVAALPQGEVLAQLERGSDAFLDFALERPRRFEAAFLLHSRQARRYPDDFVAGRSPAGNVQLRLIEKAMAQGLLEASSPIEIMMTNSALSQGLVTLYRAGRISGGENEFREIYRSAMRRSLQSFMPKGAAQARHTDRKAFLRRKS
ncbi:MAG TPA: TetR/AcrR family transcriptional regulator [Steroidobacteraceae bacterium]|nr:TetR/AcrR family transcriptional regulator [Steroidobacteraceae bacterium]